MNVKWPATRRWLANTQLARRIAEAVFRARCRNLVAGLDRVEASRCQMRSLLGLVHQGQRSAFGVEHDFRRIRTIEDFRRLVPLRSAQELSRFPTPPVSARADAARLSAVGTALALAARERPLARFFDGSIILLGDDVSLPDDPARVLPALVRPFANVRGRVTCLVGSADRLSRYFEVCRPDDRVTPVAVLYTPSPGINLSKLRSRLRPDILLLELAFRPEAAVAVEDPRLQSLRLLVDHGTFFEFLPVAERNSLNPSRLLIDQIVTGEVYELVLTAPGGYWACRTGAGVRFESRAPALIRFVPLPATAAALPARIPLATVVPQSPSHPRMSGTSAELPENYVHTPWSAPAGRG